MCDIRKLKKLKGISIRMVENIRRFDPLKLCDLKSVSDSGLTYNDLSERIDHISSCCNILELKSTFIQNGNDYDQVLKVSGGNFCKKPVICPICANRTQSRRHARFSDAIRKQAVRVKEKERFAYIITYTVTDGDSLAERMEHLKESKKAFRLFGQKRIDGRSKGEASKFRAAISAVEIKRGEGGKKWHPHSHDLVFTDKPIDYHVYDQKRKKRLERRYGSNIPRRFLDRIALRSVSFRGESVPASKVSAEWLRATGGDSMSISVEPIHHVPANCSEKKKAQYMAMSFEDSVFRQANEILKYPLKPSDNVPADMITIITDTFNKRFVATYGEFRGVPGDDYNDPAANDEETFVLTYDREKGCYGEPVPGTVRDLLEDEEITKTRSEVGRLLGDYRRRRKHLVEQRNHYGDSLSVVLDNLKQQFRNRVNQLYTLYRQSISYKNRSTYEGGIVCKPNCDKYHAPLALNGVYVPGINYRDLVSLAWS